MIEVKNDTYGLYQGKLYRIGKTYDTSVNLCSSNPVDLSKGFICNSSESFIKKYGFVCIKDVPKSEITVAYEIRSHAVYKGVGATINRHLSLGAFVVSGLPLIKKIVLQSRCKIA